MTDDKEEPNKNEGFDVRKDGIDCFCCESFGTIHQMGKRKQQPKTIKLLLMLLKIEAALK